MDEFGLHIIANLFECENAEFLVEKEKLEKFIVDLIKKHGLSVLHSHFYKFPGEESGVTGYTLLAESHVAIHTWPERNNYLSFDIFVCNFNKDNTESARKIFNELVEALKPSKVESNFIKRK